MSRTGKQTGFGMFLILLVISAIIAGIGQGLLGGLVILTLGFSGIDFLTTMIISVIMSIIIFVITWTLLYRAFFKGRTFR